MRILDLDALAMLVAVVDHGGFTAGAEAVGRTQSAVSARIADLEARLGQTLLERSRRGVRLTEPGERLVGYARRLLALQDEALADLTGAESTGRVRLGIPDDYVGPYLTPLIGRFAVQHPRIEVSIRCELSLALEAELDAGKLDLIVVTRDAHRPIGDLLRRDPTVWVAARGHRPELIDPLPLALYPEGCRFRPHLISALERRGRSWRAAYVSGSTAGIVSAIETGLCLTAINATTVPADWRRLTEADGLPPLPDTEIALVVSPTAPVAARRLADAIRSEIGTGRRAAA